MKKLFTIALCILGISTFSQNWQLVNPNFSYNYKLGSSDIITHVIQVDSIIETENGTEYHLNKVIKRIENTLDGLLNQPQFLMHKMVKHNENHFVFECPDTLVIKPKSKLNDTWTYNTNGITATVTNVYVDNNFGTQDSVKEISLSNNQQILLSKNFGILSFPESTSETYHLVGIDGDNNYGEHYPNEYDFLDYQVGDFIQTLYWNNMPVYEPDTAYRRYSKFTINSIIEDTEDYIKYGVTGKQYIDEIIIKGEFNVSNIYSYTFQKDFTGGYPNEAIVVNDITYTYIGCEEDYTFYAQTSFYKENGIYYKGHKYIWVQFESEYGSDSIRIFGTDEVHPYYYTKKFSTNLGVCFDWYYYPTDYQYKVCGIVRDGDTIGYLTSDSYLNGTSDITNSDIAEEFLVYPNPSSNQISISFPGERYFQARIIDISGQKHFEMNLRNNSSINISNYPPGIYTVQIINGKSIIGNKRIIIY